MSERAAMKRRVRGLLHRRWLEPLGAVVLAALPLAIVAALVALLFRSLGAGLVPLVEQIVTLFEEAPSPEVALATLVIMPSFDFSHLIAILPGIVIFLGVYLFIGMPISVSVSGYFLGLLRGKNPPVLQVFSCFSSRYPRALGGMLYKALWVLVWTLLMFFPPVLILSGGKHLIEVFIEMLDFNQIYVLSALSALCAIWLLSFALILVSRMLAYSMTAVCIAAQPRLPAYRAVRLSRKLMRGCKWQLIGLYLSFAHYFLPAIISGGLLIALPYIAPLLPLTEILERSIRILLWIILCANQLVLLYLAPYVSACYRAFYIERKREALMDEEITPDDFAPKQKTDYRVASPEAIGKPEKQRKKNPFQRPGKAIKEDKATKEEEEGDDALGV